MATPIYDELILSDLYKDVYGSRPRELFWNAWNRMNTVERNAEWTRLCADLEREIAEDDERHARKLRELLSDLRATMRSGAKTWRQALGWLIAADSDHFDIYIDDEQFLYSCGIGSRNVSAIFKRYGEG